MVTQPKALTQEYRCEFDILRRIFSLEATNVELAEANRRLLSDVQQLQKLVYLDPLTGLGNRRHFASCINSELRRAARIGSPMALILCDIDDFKHYNDRYGHCGGDTVLIAVGKSLTQFCRRGGDLAMRHGGDEFALILPDVQEQAVRTICAEIRRAVRSISIGDRIPERITVSIGAAIFNQRDANAAEIFIKAADRALHRAKRHWGKDCAEVRVLNDNVIALRATYRAARKGTRSSNVLLVT